MLPSRRALARDSGIRKRLAMACLSVIQKRYWKLKLGMVAMFTAIFTAESLTDECQDLAEAQTCALLWAGDANKFVCSHVLKDDIEGVEGIDLAEYYEGAVLVIDEMAAKGGRRLGTLLNALAAKDNDQNWDSRLVDRFLGGPLSPSILQQVTITSF
jgi:hypothetical protein